MSVPEVFRGGWTRVNISIGGAEPVETQTVWWLQAASAFADLRVPLTGDGDADSFAGVTRWEDPALTWDRSLDLHGRADVDTGMITWDGQDMLEAGSFGFGGGDPVVYVERWRRLPETDGRAGVVLRGEGRCLVVTGNYALTIVDDRSEGGTYRATGWYRPAALWGEVLCWPPGHDGVPSPPDDTGGWTVGDTVRLDDGTKWVVEDLWT